MQQPNKGWLSYFKIAFSFKSAYKIVNKTKINMTYLYDVRSENEEIWAYHVQCYHQIYLMDLKTCNSHEDIILNRFFY